MGLHSLLASRQTGDFPLFEAIQFVVVYHSGHRKRIWYLFTPAIDKYILYKPRELPASMAMAVVPRFWIKN